MNQQNKNVPKGLIPYNWLSQSAKRAGGPQKYIENTYNEGYKACELIIKHSTTSKNVPLFVFGALAGVGVWELSKLGMRKLNSTLDNPIKLKVHHILAQPETVTQSTDLTDCKANTETTTVTVPIDETMSNINNAGEYIEESVSASEFTKFSSDEADKSEVVCESTIDEPPEWFEKMYSVMCLLRKEFP